MKQDIDIRLNNLANVVDAIENRIEELERPTVISIEEGYTGERMNIGNPIKYQRNELKEAHKVLLECFDETETPSSAYTYLAEYFGSIEKAREVLK